MKVLKWSICILQAWDADMMMERENCDDEWKSEKISDEGDSFPDDSKELTDQEEEHNWTHTLCGFCGEEVADGGHSPSRHLDDWGRYTCHICFRPYRDIEKWKLHLEKKMCKSREQPDEPEQFLCSICEGTYFSKTDFEDHNATCLDERKYKCSFCKGGFRTKAGLKKHVFSGHLFNCGTCGGSFKSKKSLFLHKLLHTRNMPFRCDDCGSSFNYKWNFDQHRRIHTGELPYECTVCGQKFRYNCSMKVHRQKHFVNSVG